MIKRKISNLHLPFIFLVLVTCVYGLLILYSAGGGTIFPWCYKQFLHIIFCLPIIIFLSLMNIRTIYRFSWIIYFVVLAALIIVEIFGYTAMGATRWINIGSFRFQPSEPAKIAIVLMLARYFYNISEQNVNKMRYLMLPIAAVLIPVALVIKQPDLGTGILILIVASSMFFAAGVSIKKFLILGATIIGSAPILWTFLKEYQKKRILVFLNPEFDPKGASYNVIQSKIAIGSGRVFGKGLASGTQSHLNFLPEHQTDFIFASLCEEFGFVGGLLLLVLYSAIIYTSIAIAVNARNVYSKLLIIGIISIFFSHIFINIAMVMGLMPAVGVPLPLISYGGTMMGSMLGGFAIIMNLHINRDIDLQKP
ncbi:MAG UNVERIFIED_CONTAM: rod shape-determining protein RodA [Rickettsiaceae bacterium]